MATIWHNLILQRKWKTERNENFLKKKEEIMPTHTHTRALTHAERQTAANDRMNDASFFAVVMLCWVSLDASTSEHFSSSSVLFSSLFFLISCKTLNSKVSVFCQFSWVTARNIIAKFNFELEFAVYFSPRHLNCHHHAFSVG